ncbi:MAG: hypothetical protein ACI95S_000182 [Dinoroseobacter sp.]|jgi:hypothetical protein
MKRLILASVLALGLSGPALAQTAENPGVEDTIQGQLEAFKVDDFATAFMFASPNIRGMFRTPENFGLMVRQGFPMVWRPADVEFLGLRDEAGQLWQRVQVRDAQGGLHQLDYNMIETESGWQINGVQMVAMLGVGV